MNLQEHVILLVTLEIPGQLYVNGKIQAVIRSRSKSFMEEGMAETAMVMVIMLQKK